MPTLRKKFGKRLRKIRDDRKLTQEQFSELLGISVDFLSLIERGRNAPSFEKIEQIATRLRLPVSELFEFDLSHKRAEYLRVKNLPQKDRGGA